MKQILLTQNKAALVDDEDYDRVRVFKWHAYRDPDSGTWYAASWQSGQKIKLHRFVLGLRYGEALEVDHRDSNGLNNLKTNLRKASHAENMRNRSIQRNNTSGFKGVCRDRLKWKAYIKSNGKMLHLGVFLKPEDAANAYDVKARQLYGEFARLNFKG